MNRRKFTKAAGAVGLIGIGAACTGDGGDGSSDSSGDATSDAGGDNVPEDGDDDGMELLSKEFYTEEYGGFGVKGRIRNNTGEAVEYVAVKTVYLDADGVQVAEGLDNVSDLKAGRTWAYDSMAFADVDPSTLDSYDLSVEWNNY